MNNRESPLYWSFPLGTWFLTRVRISVFFPLIVLVLCFRFGLQLGAALSGILFLSVLLHEFGHIVAARLTGGSGNEILIWPLGGLASIQTAGTFQSRFLTAAAGPLVNLALCAVTLWPVITAGYAAGALNPLQLPFAKFSENMPAELLVLVFTVNWVLFLLNLIPVYPLDGGRMLQACLAARWGGETATEVYIRIGFVFAFVMMFAGLLFPRPDGSTMLVFIGAVVLVLNMQESFQLRTADGYDESFMGYDFSQGYTSLERSADEPAQPRLSLLQRWREKRRAEKRRREEARELEAAQQLDAILEKVHQHGIDSLTEAERRQLDRASARYRDKGKNPSS